MAYFFSTPVDIDIVLDDGDDRQMVDMKTEKGRREKAPLYKDGESVKGAVTIRPKDGKRLEHTGIKVKFVGTIGMFQCIIPTYINSPMAQRCSSIEGTTTNSSLWVKS
jgi:vacuolar protein sorting-associated protein 26